MDTVSSVRSICEHSVLIKIEKQAIVVNGQFPGPLIEANWGECYCLLMKESNCRIMV